MAIRPLQVGPPTRRELAPGHTPLIFDREALRAPAHKLFKHKYTGLRVAKPTLNSITCALTFSLPTGAPHTVSTEHDRGSQRELLPQVEGGRHFKAWEWDFEAVPVGNRLPTRNSVWVLVSVPGVRRPI